MSIFQQVAGRTPALLLRLALVNLLILILCFSVSYYRSDYMFTLAEHGLKTFTDYGSIISDAAKFNDAATLKYTDYSSSTGDTEAAISILNKSSPGINSWQGWERNGMLLEKQGFSEDGTIDKVETASQLYDRVLEVYPTYQTGLQRSALIALKLGNWGKAYALADQLDFYYFGNLESNYIRAKAAEGEGDTIKQIELLMRVSSSGNTSTSTLFSIENVRDQLSLIMSNSKK